MPLAEPESEEVSRGDKSDHCKREDSSEKERQLLNSRSSVISNIKVMYANAQSLKRKMSELLTTTVALSPDVIGITESWGDQDLPDSEFTVPGFTMFRSDRVTGHRGGGVLLLVKNEINPVEVKMKSKFMDQVWCKISQAHGDELLIGVCYRSLNTVLFGKDNDACLQELITEIRGRPLLLMGDFNFPDIDWSSSAGSTPSSQSFVDCIDGAFLTQHVTQCTCKDAVLDLVFTSEPDIIDSF